MTVRTKEQLTVLLKLVDVNNASLTRMNCNTRQKVWQIITQKLNSMQGGAQKDMDGWKRSYYSWRFNIGSDCKKELQKIIKNVVDDDFFYINVSEDVVENDNASDAGEVVGNSPSEKQKTRLHELILKHRQILLSTADDEPLKSQIWLNIAEELNDMPNGLQLTISEWNKRVDWEQYVMRRGRKPTKRAASTTLDKNVKRFVENQPNVKNMEYEVLGNETTLDSQDVDSPEQEYTCLDELIVEELEPEPEASVSANDSANQFEEYQENNCQIEEEVLTGTETLLNGDDNNANDEENCLDLNEYEDEPEYKPQMKRISTPPIVKSFKYSHRLTTAVEKLSNDVGDMKDLLKRTSRTLECLESVLQQQSKQQDETNALLKRNGQLLKVLVECKTGRRANGNTK